MFALRNFGRAVNVNGVLSEGERLQGKMARFGWVFRPLGRSSWPKRVGQLVDGEYALATMTFALLRAHTDQQAEVVLLDGYLSAAGLEFALGAVPVQDKVGRRGAGEQPGEFIEALPHFAGQGRGLHRSEEHTS